MRVIRLKLLILDKSQCKEGMAKVFFRRDEGTHHWPHRLLVHVAIDLIAELLPGTLTSSARPQNGGLISKPQSIASRHELIEATINRR